MRVLYSIDYYKPAYSYGGPVNSTSALCEGLARLGIELTVLTTNANKGLPLDVPLRIPVDVDGVEVHYYPIKSGFPESYFYSPELAKALTRKDRQSDLVVLDLFYTHAMHAGVSACRSYKIPYIIPTRGQLFTMVASITSASKSSYIYIIGQKFFTKCCRHSLHKFH